MKKLFGYAKFCLAVGLIFMTTNCSHLLESGCELSSADAKNILDADPFFGSMENLRIIR